MWRRVVDHLETTWARYQRSRMCLVGRLIAAAAIVGANATSLVGLLTGMALDAGLSPESLHAELQAEFGLILVAYRRAARRKRHLMAFEEGTRNALCAKRDLRSVTADRA